MPKTPASPSDERPAIAPSDPSLICWNRFLLEQDGQEGAAGGAAAIPRASQEKATDAVEAMRLGAQLLRELDAQAAADDVELD